MILLQVLSQAEQGANSLQLGTRRNRGEDAEIQQLICERRRHIEFLWSHLGVGFWGVGRKGKEIHWEPSANEFLVAGRKFPPEQLEMLGAICGIVPAVDGQRLLAFTVKLPKVLAAVNDLAEGFESLLVPCTRWC